MFSNFAASIMFPTEIASVNLANAASKLNASSGNIQQEEQTYSKTVDDKYPKSTSKGLLHFV